MASTAYTVTVINRCEPYLQGDGTKPNTSYGASPPGTVTTTQGQQVDGVVKAGMWFTPNVNVTTNFPPTKVGQLSNQAITQIASGNSAVVGCADSGQNWYGITIVGNVGLPIQSPNTDAAVPAKISNSAGINFNVQNFTQPLTVLHAAVNTATYYTLTVTVASGARSDVTIVVTMFVPPAGFDAWDPRSIGPIYQIPGSGSKSNPSPAPFTPGAVFKINTLNDIVTDSASNPVFAKFGTVVTATGSDGSMRTSPCYRASSDKPYQCVKGVGTSTEMLTQFPTPTNNLSDLFTFDVFTLPNGTMIMMLRNLQYGYLYVTNPPPLSTDPHNFNLGFDPLSKSEMKLKLAANRNLLVAGQWTVIAVNKQPDPSTFWWNTTTTKTVQACGQDPGIKEWGAFNKFGSNPPQTYYLLYRDQTNSQSIFFLQSGTGMWVNIGHSGNDSHDNCKYYWKSDGNIGRGDNAGRTPHTGWQRSYNPPMKPYHEGNHTTDDTGFVGRPCNNSRLPYVYDYEDSGPTGLPMISNEDFAVSQSSNNIISTQPLYLPHGPFYLTRFPDFLQFWLWVEYYACYASYGAEVPVWFYRTQAINNNFTFTLAGPPDVARILALDSSYMADCLQVVPFPVPYTLTDSSAGQYVCPTFALYGYPSPANPPCAAAQLASSLIKKLALDPTNASLGTQLSAAESSVAKTPGCVIESSLSLLNKPTDRVSASQNFLRDVCGARYNNGENGISCLSLATQDSSYCSGFRTSNFSAACAIACDQAPGDCNDAKSNFCSSNFAANDCACINITDSPFLNPLTNAVDASNQHISVTYKDYVTGGHMEIETAQDASGTCWWHPCVVDKIPALALDQDGNVNGCVAKQYMSCTNTLDGANIENSLNTTLLLYNSCYLAKLTGNGNPPYIPNKGTGTAGAPSMQPPDTGGPSAAPGPKPAPSGLSAGTIGGLVVVGLIVAAILAGILYFLFKPRAPVAAVLEK
jgi:hypothetical protein